MHIYSTAVTLNCDKFEHCKGISGHFNFAIRHLWLFYDPQTLKLWSLANIMSYLRLFKTDFYITWSHMIAYANYRWISSLLSYHRQNGSCIFYRILATRLCMTAKFWRLDLQQKQNIKAPHWSDRQNPLTFLLLVLTSSWYNKVDKRKVFSEAISLQIVAAHAIKWAIN